MPDTLGDNRLRAVIGVALAIGLIVLLAVVFDLGPCAEDELSEAEFLAQGDEICTEAHESFLSEQDNPPRTAGEAASLTEGLITIAQEELDAIRDLDGPDSLQAPLERYFAARERGIEDMEAGRAAAEDGDAQGYAKAQAIVAGKQLGRFRIAREIGFNECSRPLVDRDELAEQSEPPPEPTAPPTVSNPPTGG